MLTSLAVQKGVSPEIVVVDNGSTDGSVESVESFAKTYQGPVQIIRNDRNLGFCAANNQGFQAASGRWVALLNNDAEADPEWLIRLVDSLKQRAGFGMAASKSWCGKTRESSTKPDI